MNRWILACLSVSVVFTLVKSNCYDNSSRCTPQTNYLTGIVFESCYGFCRQCRGQAGGRCERVHNRECSGGYQCQCRGEPVSKSENPLVIATCKLGL